MKLIAAYLSLSFMVLAGLAHAAPVPATATQACAVDDLNRHICTPQPVKRIISLAPGVTELVFAAGGGDKLIAVDDHSDYPESVSTLPTIGGYPNVNAEAIVKMKPDLLVIWSGGNSAQLSSQLETLGFTIFYADPVDFEGIASVIKRLGTVMGTDDVAQKNANAFLQQYTAIKQQFNHSTPVRTFFEIWNDPLMTVNGGHIISQSIELCGGVNVFADAQPRVPKVSMESLLARNPEAIVSSEIVRGDQTILDRWKPYSRISAVKNGFLFTVPGDLITRPTPRALKGAEILCQHFERVRAAHRSPDSLS